MRKKYHPIFLGAVLCAAAISAGAVYAMGMLKNPRTSTTFYEGHTHHMGETQGAPGHSGGTDAYGCHNGSVPYHCH